MQYAKRLRKEWSPMDATLKFNLRAAIKATNHKRSFERFSYCDWPLLFAGILTRTQEPIFGKQKACTDSLVFKRPRATLQRIYAPRIPGFNLHFVILSKLCTDTNFSKYWYVCVLFSIYCFYLLEKISYFLVFFSSVLLGGCLDRDWTETDRDVLHFGMTSSPV